MFLDRIECYTGQQLRDARKLGVDMTRDLLCEKLQRVSGKKGNSFVAIVQNCFHHLRALDPTGPKP